MDGYHSVAENFKINIRRSAREKMRSEKRRIFHFGCPPIMQIARSLDLPLLNYTLEQLVNKRRDELTNRTKTLKEKFGQGNQYQENIQPIIISFEGHLNFWSFAVEQIFTDKYLPNEFFFQFLDEYISLNSHRQIAFNKTYELKVLNTFDLSALAKMPGKLKQKMMEWVQGTEGITLIFNCISKQFLDLETYKNIYFILIEGLKDKVYDKEKYRKNVEECISILTSICHNADMDELNDLLREYPVIVNSLMDIVMKKMHEKQLIILATDCILSLFNTYSETVLNYARLGIAYLSGLLICSGEETCIMKGLQILRMLCQVQMFDMIKFLLDEDGQVCKTGLWERFRVGSYIYNTRNLNIRKESYCVLANMFANGQYEQVLQLSSIICEEDFDVLDLMKKAIEEQEDECILQNVLSIISCLLFYGQQQKDENENIILQKIKDKGIDKTVELLLEHRCQQIRNSSDIILKGVNGYENDSQI